jgi:enoyl-CoA hydratase/carnithine racemase
MPIDYEAHAPVFGSPLIEIDLDGGEAVPALRPPGSILIGLDRRGRLPPAGTQFDLLLTSASQAPRPWVAAGTDTFEATLGSLRKSVNDRPLAVATLTQVLRIGSSLPFAEALAVESFAYSTLLGGSEFRAWLQAHPRKAVLNHENRQRTRLSREGGIISVELANPARHNAIDALMRDALCEAFSAVLDDPTAEALHIRATGRAFSVGGELEEFGTAADLATAHAIRSLRSPAFLLHRLRDRATVFVHGACIGSGIEIPAAARHIVAQTDSWFSLPEVSMGLIPGAGGTVTLTARIGRQRVLWWALANRKLNVTVAEDWGLVDAVETKR